MLATRWHLGKQYRELRTRLRHLSVLGGCCGTDHRHIVAICDACLPPHRRLPPLWRSGPLLRRSHLSDTR